MVVKGRCRVESRLGGAQRASHFKPKKHVANRGEDRHTPYPPRPPPTTRPTSPVSTCLRLGEMAGHHANTRRGNTKACNKGVQHEGTSPHIPIPDITLSSLIGIKRNVPLDATTTGDDASQRKRKRKRRTVCCVRVCMKGWGQTVEGW